MLNEAGIGQPIIEKQRDSLINEVDTLCFYLYQPGKFRGVPNLFGETSI